MSLSMDNSNYMYNRNHSKDIGTFLSKKLLMPSHVIRNALDDLERVKCSAHNLYRIFWSKPEVSILKMAEIWPIL